MARPKPAYNLAGTVPAEHGLETIRQALLRSPRTRHFAIVELSNMHTGTDHPDDEPDFHAPIILLHSLEPITDKAEVDQIKAMRDRARSARSGQGTLDEAALPAGKDGGSV